MKSLKAICNNLHIFNDYKHDSMHKDVTLQQATMVQQFRTGFDIFRQDMNIPRYGRRCSVTDSLEHSWILGGCWSKCREKGFI